MLELVLEHQEPGLGLSYHQKHDILTRAQACGIDVAYLTNPDPIKQSHKIKISLEKLCTGIIVTRTWEELHNYLGYNGHHKTSFKVLVRQACSAYNIDPHYLYKFQQPGTSEQLGMPHTNSSATKQSISEPEPDPDHPPSSILELTPKQLKRFHFDFACSLWGEVNDPENYQVDPSDPSVMLELVLEHQEPGTRDCRDLFQRQYKLPDSVA